MFHLTKCLGEKKQGGSKGRLNQEKGTELIAHQGG